MIDYSIAAIPTVYKGQTFRSRLEAKWAAFFDLLGWTWCYEPFDFGGWSPDFAIRAPGAFSVRKIVLAEVKPVMELDEEIMDKMTNNCPHHTQADHYGWSHYLPEYELLLLGLTPTEGRLGWLKFPHRLYSDPYIHLTEAIFGLWNGEVGFSPDSLNSTNRINGEDAKYDVFSRLGFDLGRSFIMNTWGQACATVQWKPSRRAPAA